jgi:hypothetical protein
MSPTIFKLSNHPAQGLTPVATLEVLHNFQVERHLESEVTFGSVNRHSYLVSIGNDGLAQEFRSFLDTRGVEYEIVDYVPRPGEGDTPQAVQEPVQVMAEAPVPVRDNGPSIGTIYIRAKMTREDASGIAQQIAAEHPDIPIWCNATQPDSEEWTWVGFSNHHVCGWFLQIAKTLGLQVDENPHKHLPDGRQGSLILINPPTPQSWEIPQRQPEPVAQPTGRGRMRGWAGRVRGFRSRDR